MKSTPPRSRSKNGDIMKKRQQKAPVSGNSAGYATDGELSESASDANGNRQHRKGRRRTPKEQGGKSEFKGSVIMMVLVVGLLFCLMDALYIGRVLDRPGWVPSTESSNRSTGSTNTATKKIAAVSKGGVINNKQWTREERIRFMQQKREQKLAEAKVAEEKRLANVKAAALEALMAANGGKLPDDYDPDNEQFRPRHMAHYRDMSVADDKDRILRLFLEAGLKEMDDATYDALPTWADVSKMYGDEPRILGLDQCETFQKKGNPWDHFVSTAGTFNTGTNLMAEMLIHNCHNQARMEKLGQQNRGVRWQVPWGKHTPPGDEAYRLSHKSVKDKNVDATMILPAVTIRDPYYWMQSMCKHHYTAAWRLTDHCPNLTPSETDQANVPSLRGKDFFPLSVRYADFVRHHKSLVGLWNDWYNEYKGVEFQHLYVRYEDLLFHPKEVTETVCHCAGGTMNKGKFQYVVDSAKKGLGAHGSIRTGYVDAIIKYGSDRNRYNGYTPADFKYAREHLDPTMMTEFGYKYHPMSLEEETDEIDGEAVEVVGDAEEENAAQVDNPGEGEENEERDGGEHEKGEEDGHEGGDHGVEEEKASDAAEQ